MEFIWWIIIKSFLSVFLLSCIYPEIISICPEKCTCKKITENGTELRARCGGTPQNKIQTFKELDFYDDFKNITNLDVSKNQISFIERADFMAYTNLKRLNLSYNSLKQIDDTMFGEIPSLERLDLSTNVIVHVHQGSFEKLTGLKILDISNNPLACDCDLLWLVTWSNNASVKLKPSPKCETPKPFRGYALKKLRIGQDLHCESPLQPLLELKPDTDQLVFEGDKLVLRCRAPRVAVGAPNDSEDLPVKAHLFWGWSEKIVDPNSTEDIIYRDPTVHFPSIQIDAKHLSDSGLLDSILKIPYVTRNHTGMWDCRLRSQQANLSRSISVLVISEKTKYCPATMVHNNKGKYYWPRTVRGRTVRLSCAGIGIGGALEIPASTVLITSSHGGSGGMASFTCTENGKWEHLNTDQCPFISETTRILEQFAKMNLSIAKGSVLESAKRLRNFTQSSNDVLNKIKDPIDLVFIGKTIRNYLQFLQQEKDLGTMLLDIVSQIQILPENLVRNAQALDISTAGTQLVQAVEFAAQYTSSSLTHKPNLAIEYFKIGRFDELFNGLTCAWFKPGIGLHGQRIPSETETEESSEENVESKEEIEIQQQEDMKIRVFQCNTASQAIDIFKNYIDASVQIPQNFLPNPPAHQIYHSEHQITENIREYSDKLMIAVYDNGNFFPDIMLNRTTQYQITSSIIGVKLLPTSLETASILDEYQQHNLSEPVSIMLRARPFHHETSFPIPVYWDAEKTAWVRGVCQFSYYFHGLVVFTCNRLGYYGLMQHRKHLNDFLNENAGAKFRFSPSGFYIGSLVLFLCTWINIITYLLYGNSIQMARRQRHSLINTWLALSMLVLIFSIGIYQTENLRVCQIFGICIHYFSLCVLLWVCVNVSTMYKRLSKRLQRRGIPIDELPVKENLPGGVGKKPILGIYLAGWGIGLIICGISGAVNIREYASYSYCFLKTGPALSAIFVPAMILLLFILIMFVCIRCHIRSDEAHFHQNDHFSEGTQATENVDLKLLETSAATTAPVGATAIPTSTYQQQQQNHYRSLTLSSPTTSMLVDMEHSNSSQLKAYFAFLILYIASWLSAAASIVSPFHEQKFSYEEEVFSILFSIITIILGVFLVFFHCVSRSDVRRVWSSLSLRNCCLSKKGCCRRRRSVGDTKELNTVAYHHHHHHHYHHHNHSHTCGSASGGIGGGCSGSHHSGGSRSTSQCSKRASSCVGSGGGGGAAGGHQSSPNKNLTTPPSSLLLLNRQQFIHNPVILPQEIPTAEIFYNPNQINVARKFFKKQKRLAKRNNFELQRQLERNYGDANSDVSSSIGSSSYPRSRVSADRRGMSSIFTGGSKINNTNIHVKNSYLDDYNNGMMTGRSTIGTVDSRKIRPNVNLNVLSDSCNESNDLLADTERLVLGAENARIISATTVSAPANTASYNNSNKVNNTEMIANIYTNVPETLKPQHEIVTMRADEKFRRSVNVSDLLEQDEIENCEKQQSNDLNHIGSPRFFNSNNINQQQRVEQLRPELELKTCKDNESNTDNQLIFSLNSPIATAAMNTIGLPTMMTSTPTNNTVTVTAEITSPTTKIQHNNDYAEDEHNSSQDENHLDLHRNETYVSKPLEITDQVYENDYESSIRIGHQDELYCQQQKSKSFDNLDLIITSTSASTPMSIITTNSKILRMPSLNKRKPMINSSNFCDQQIRSISCSNLSQIDDEIIFRGINKPNPHQLPSKSFHHHHQNSSNVTPCMSNSPVLFSPSLCEIDDLPSPSHSPASSTMAMMIDHRRKPLILSDEDVLDVMIDNSNLINTNCDAFNEQQLHQYQQNSSSSNSFSLVNGNQNHHNHQQRHNTSHNFTSSSPTCESDLNYQNSELSIRSHGVYAPQPSSETDLNLTLTGDEHMFYPYQSSEISDILDDDDDDDDGNDNPNCSNDCLLPSTSSRDNINGIDEFGNGSQSSIDELYQQIKRRSDSHRRQRHHFHNKDDENDEIAESDSMITNLNEQNDGMTEIVTTDVGATGTVTKNNGFQKSSVDIDPTTTNNENDDDSSQCSIISYIDPNECTTGGKASIVNNVSSLKKTC